ncbi:hypothetical protein J2Y69_000663 [Microbacterium resistens]|uniref:Uncharacterized protein n=1 Tax=Microbacterium resistens TaxID=156977 RepID=A0ABU1SAY8_9MICO|nr:hypothetical protein [Microbacterium resistens]MDR6866078.1 hypothetical protein [Microbacterium resistens]
MKINLPIGLKSAAVGKDYDLRLFETRFQPEAAIVKNCKLALERTHLRPERRLEGQREKREPISLLQFHAIDGRDSYFWVPW